MNTFRNVGQTQKHILSCVLLKNEKVVELILFPSYVSNPVVPWFASFTKELGAYSKKKKVSFKVSKGLMRTSLCLFPKVVFQSAGIEADKVQLSLLFLFVA